MTLTPVTSSLSRTSAGCLYKTIAPGGQLWLLICWLTAALPVWFQTARPTAVRCVSEPRVIAAERGRLADWLAAIQYCTTWINWTCTLVHTVLVLAPHIIIIIGAVSLVFIALSGWLTLNVRGLLLSLLRLFYPSLLYCCCLTHLCVSLSAFTLVTITSAVAWYTTAPTSVTTSYFCFLFSSNG